jgi:hypothetical protein
MKPSPLIPLVIVVVALAIVVGQLTNSYEVSMNTTNVTTANGTSTTVTTSATPQQPGGQIDVMIISNNGYEAVSLSYLVNGSRILAGKEAWIHEKYLNNSSYYYVIVLNESSGWFGYLKVPGSVLNEVVKNGTYAVYSWIMANIRLKPLDQYPKSSLSIIIKAPNGELIKGGTLCIYSMTGKQQCVRVTNGIVRFSNLTTELYLVSYIMMLHDNVTINVYGYTVSTILIIDLTGNWLLIPNNGTVTVTPHAMLEQMTSSTNSYLIAAIIPGAASKYTTSTSIVLAPVVSVNITAVALMLIAVILGGLAALLILPRTVRK